MADKNLHDIKIDDLDNKSKKTPMKNILTLLALLFIILVISVAITRLILDTDEDGLNDMNDTNISRNVLLLDEATKDTEKDNSVAATAGIAAAGVAGAVLANGTTLKDRGDASSSNSSSSEDKDSSTKDSGSKIKATLREHTPVKQELTTHTAPAPKKHVVKKEPVHHTVKDKKYVDKVVSSSSHSTQSSKKTSTHNVSHLGDKRAGYYIKVGTFKDTSNAVNKIKKTGLDYILIKPKNDKTTTRVLIGPFKSNWGAKQHLPRVKNSIAEGAYITRIN